MYLGFWQAIKKRNRKKIKEKKMAFIFGIIALLVGALFVLIGVMPDTGVPWLGRITSVVAGIFLILVSIGAAFA
ncbi:putative membrane protein of unknown function [Limnospira indica PCC 8005]|uniref:DUF3784 domain-containing protein n=1 Tax=Limnospira indica PCC 8005 TaxID=376219 RepID=A0A9P1P043_9CYAN|nr:DUF3784 domain-containing protein [Limnospira indica]CDM96510.1 putative membrane protein of unknown function [Limnospira indica PCC 8005]